MGKAFATDVFHYPRIMRSADHHLRRWAFGTFLGAWVLFLPCMSATAVQASPPAIESMSVAELNRMISNGRGHYLFFFTAAWCGHCKAMLPALNRLHHRFHNEGPQIIGISVDAGGPSAMQAVLDDHRADFPVVWVGEGALDAYRLVGIPMVFLVRDGQLVEKIPGKCSYTLLEKKILDLIK